MLESGITTLKVTLTFQERVAVAKREAHANCGEHETTDTQEASTT